MIKRKLRRLTVWMSSKEVQGNHSAIFHAAGGGGERRKSGKRPDSASEYAHLPFDEVLALPSTCFKSCNGHQIICQSIKAALIFEELFGHFDFEMLNILKVNATSVKHAHGKAHVHHFHFVDDTELSFFIYAMSLKLQIDISYDDDLFKAQLIFHEFDRKLFETDFAIHVEWTQQTKIPSGFISTQLEGALTSVKCKNLIRDKMTTFEIICDKIILKEEQLSVEEVILSLKPRSETPPVEEDSDEGSGIFDDEEDL